MKNNLVILISAMLIALLSPRFSNAEIFSQTIGDDDNFGGWPSEPPIYGWDTRSSEEVNATNGAQFTDISNDSYQRTFLFDFRGPFINIVQATLEIRVHDLEDDDSGFGYPPEHVDIQININGFDVPGAFDDMCYLGTSAVVTSDILTLLGVDILEDICADGQISVQFLNGETYQEYYAIDWISLEIEGFLDSDRDGLANELDNCPNHPNGPDLGTCTTSNPVKELCYSNEDCDPNEFCSLNQEDMDNDGIGDICDDTTMCQGLADYDNDVDGTDAFMFKSHFGRSLLKNPCPPNGPAPVPKTGQTTCYEGVDPFSQIDCTDTGHDGEYQSGVDWPNPRFTDNGDGTVMDNLTGLIWLKEADCFGTRTWNEALSDCKGLASGLCGLTDGSSSGDWRLPNKNELASLVHNEYYGPALPNTAGTGQWSAGDPFTNVQSGYYWSSSTYAVTTNAAWSVYMEFGSVEGIFKSHITYVWPVRGGH